MRQTSALVVGLLLCIEMSWLATRQNWTGVWMAVAGLAAVVGLLLVGDSRKLP